MISRYVVIGNPVGHSKSPEIHAAFASEVGHLIQYDRLLAPLDKFVETVASFKANGGAGCNITLPFKVQAFQLATSLSERATIAGAVNVLRFDADAIFGDNTDGIGLIRDIENNSGFSIAGKRVLLLGAGGGARGAVSEIIRSQPAELVISNRTMAKAITIADYFGKLINNACVIKPLAISELHGRSFDLIINATSASLHGQSLDLPAELFAPNSLAYDMLYGNSKTPFLQLARHANAICSDGLGMLVEQAAEAFYLWRGVRPDTALVLKMLRSNSG